MTFGDWVEESRFKIEQYGPVRGVRSAAYDFWGGAARRGARTLGLDRTGTNVYDREWDVLLLLDTCRPDVLGEVAGGYDYLPTDVPTHRSVGSTSWEWLEKTFRTDRREELSETAYVCANGFSKEFGDAFRARPEDFGLLDEVWRYGWDDRKGICPPATVTDRAVAVARETNFERLIVHYMQPHAPYRSLDVVGRSTEADDDGNRRSVWDLLQMGDLSPGDAWEAYRDNLRWVLDDGVTPLLRNVDADRVVISSDHGEAFGEWGFYGHYRHVPVDALRVVPWVETTAEDHRTLDPTVEPKSVDLTTETVDERLAALGYR
jgi:hypothetical protein